jgi:hypothetical protein
VCAVEKTCFNNRNRSFKWDDVTSRRTGSRRQLVSLGGSILSECGEKRTRFVDKLETTTDHCNAIGKFMWDRGKAKSADLDHPRKRTICGDRERGLTSIDFDKQFCSGFPGENKKVTRARDDRTAAALKSRAGNQNVARKEIDAARATLTNRLCTAIRTTMGKAILRRGSGSGLLASGDHWQHPRTIDDDRNALL